PAGIKAETRKVLGLLVPEGRKSFTNIEIIIIIRLTHGGWTAALSKGFCPAEGGCFPQEHLFKGARVSCNGKNCGDASVRGRSSSCWDSDGPFRPELPGM